MAALPYSLDGRLSPSATETSTEEEISSLSLEQSVWSLIHTLYSYVQSSLEETSLSSKLN